MQSSVSQYLESEILQPNNISRLKLGRAPVASRPTLRKQLKLESNKWFQDNENQLLFTSGSAALVTAAFDASFSRGLNQPPDS